MVTTHPIRTLVFCVAVAVVIAGATLRYSSPLAQQAPAAPAAPTPQSLAPIDLTGVWVSIVTEEWRWRMVTPPKGDFASIPITDEARRVGETWDPARDTAEGNACRAYGAVGIMRIPARYRISWQDANTLKMEIDAGQQTRLFRFGDAPRPTGNTDWQGFSAARWQRPGGGDLAAPAAAAPGGGGFGQVGGAPPVAPAGRGGAGRGRGAAAAAPAPPARGGSLLVETTNMKAGYLRKNGLPYSENAQMTESFFVHREPDGNQWLVVQQKVRDPRYLNAEYVSSWHYRKEPDASKWRPTPCVAS